MRERRLNAEEAALWARVVASVAPLEGRSGSPSSPPKSGEDQTPKGPGGQPRCSPPLDASVPHRKESASANTLDGSWDRKLARGLVQPDLAIDLHGHNLDTAYRTLDAGLDQALAQGARMLLLVTGKPRAPGSGRGAIRAAVGDWLAASRHAGDIAAVRTAHPRHGGSGALYIILRRRRTTRSF